MLEENVRIIFHASHVINFILHPKGKPIIYGLVDPVTLELRYVGQSTAHLRRYREESQTLEGLGKATRDWIISIWDKGRVPLPVLILKCNKEDLDFYEAEMIKAYRDAGARLTNMTPGGHSWPQWTAEHNANRVSSLRIALLGNQNGLGNKGPIGYKHTEANKSLYSRQRIGNTHGSGNRGNHPSEATRQKLSKCKLGNTNWVGRKHSEETKQKMRQSHQLWRQQGPMMHCSVCGLAGHNRRTCGSRNREVNA